MNPDHPTPDLLAECKRELEQFAYIVSHDLQAPLRTQMSFVQLLRMEYGDSLQGDALEYLRFIENSAQTMQDLIQGLLLFSRAGRVEVGHDKVPLDEVLQNARVEVRSLADDSNAVIHCEALPVIEGNREALTQLFAHLLRNALQYRSPERTPLVEITHTVVDDTVRITITDNGTGIAPELHESAFEIFRRLQNERDAPRGAGMGLPVSRRIAACHGGDVRILPTDSPGTRVEVRLPLHHAG